MPGAGRAGDRASARVRHGMSQQTDLWQARRFWRVDTAGRLLQLPRGVPCAVLLAAAAAAAPAAVDIDAADGGYDGLAAAAAAAPAAHAPAALLLPGAAAEGVDAAAGAVPAPLRQAAAAAADVECRPALALVVRPSGGPACVTPASAEALAARGWTVEREAAAPRAPAVPAPAPAPAGPDGAPSPPSPPFAPAALDIAALPRQDGAAASGAYSPGPYAVGVVPNFVRDPARPFDAWGAEYKGAAYARLLDSIAEAGDPSTTATNIYYPSPPGGSRVERPAADASGHDVHPAALWAPVSGERQTLLGMYMGSAELAAAAPAALEGRTFGHQSYRGAPPAAADGPFPLVVMVHGLGGGLFTWSQAAEYLASHGYVVVTVAHSSDSGDTPVFEDPASAFAGEAGPGGVAAAYELRSSETGQRLFANFFRLLYGHDAGPVRGPGSMPDPSALRAVPGGGIAAGAMMGALFEQRLGDLAAVLSEMRALNLPERDCRAALGPGGGAGEKAACGLLAGMIDDARIGAVGHSLGSMTVQAALAFLPEVDAAVGFNNGLPKRWEPHGGMPNAGQADPPAGVPGPLMLVTGSDDAFVHMVFRELHLRWFEQAGGDVSETYPLGIERAWPTADNRQPVARAAYERAQAEKVLVEFADEGHSNAVDDYYPLDAPGSVVRALRVPLKPGGAQDEYAVLGWVRDGGGLVLLPHQMRNYFVTNWFDWLLKGDDSARAMIAGHPFGAGVRSMLHEGLEAPQPRPGSVQGQGGGSPCGAEGYALIGDTCQPAPEGYVETRTPCEMAVDSREAAGVDQDYLAELERCRRG